MLTIIPCAGKGTRLSPWTHEKPKEMLDTGGQTMISLLEKQVGHSPIVVSNKHKSSLNREIYKHFFFPKLIFQEEEKGLGDAIRTVGRSLGTGDCVAIALPDEYLNPDPLREMKARYVDTGKIQLASTLVSPNQAHHYGILDRQRNEIIEKPTGCQGPRRLEAIVGRYVLPPRIFYHLENLTPDLRTGEVELTAALNQLLKEYDFEVHQVERRIDLGTKQGLLEVSQEAEVS